MDYYAVIGNPISHSLSPYIHTLFAEQTGQAISYKAIHANLDKFVEKVKEFRAEGGKGMNVTLPFKEQAWMYATERSERAVLAGTANTLIFRDKSCICDNTDGIGLIRDLTQRLNHPVQDASILLLGAGGAALGVIAPLLARRPSHVHIANRTAAKAHQLAETFKLAGYVTSSDLAHIPAGPFDIIINSTSCSLQQTLPEPLPTTIVGSETLCYDLAYSAQPTIFLQWANKLGAKQCADGLGMLVAQAAESFFLWRDVYPDTGKIMNLVKARLARN